VYLCTPATFLLKLRLVGSLRWLRESTPLRQLVPSRLLITCCAFTLPCAFAGIALAFHVPTGESRMELHQLGRFARVFVYHFVSNT